MSLFTGAGKAAVDAASPRSPAPALRDPANLVSPRARTYWATRALVLWLVLLAGEVFWLSTTTGSSHALPVTVLVVTVVLAAVDVLVMPQWRYRVHRWEVTGTAVYTQSGWLSQQRRIAPLSRIQTVDTARGPFEQLFRLSSITVTTASAKGPLRIEGLARDTADALVAELTTAVEQAAGDAT